MLARVERKDFAQLPCEDNLWRVGEVSRGRE
jgi:hypothetical protein